MSEQLLHHTPKRCFKQARLRMLPARENPRPASPGVHGCCGACTKRSRALSEIRLPGCSELGWFKDLCVKPLQDAQIQSDIQVWPGAAPACNSTCCCWGGARLVGREGGSVA